MAGLMASLVEKVNVTRVVADHWSTLRASPSAPHYKPLDFILMYGLPTVVGVLLAWRGVQATSLDGLIAGTSLLAGVLVTLLFSSVHLLEDDGHATTVRRRRQMTRAAYHNVAYAFVVTVVTTGMLIAIEATTPASVTTVAADGTTTESAATVSTWATAVLAGLGLHLGLTLLMIVNRLYTVIDHDAAHDGVAS